MWEHKRESNTLELRIYLDKNKILARIIGNLRHYLIKSKILCHRKIRKGKDPEKRVDQESLERSLLSVQNGSLLWASLIYIRIILPNCDKMNFFGNK